MVILAASGFFLKSFERELNSEKVVLYQVRVWVAWVSGGEVQLVFLSMLDEVNLNPGMEVLILASASFCRFCDTVFYLFRLRRGCGPVSFSPSKGEPATRTATF